MRKSRPSPFLLGLFLPAFLGACALPLNTAVRDWSNTAGLAVSRPGIVRSNAADATLAMQQALFVYFAALGVLWDQAELSFDATQFAALERRAPDPAASAAIGELGRILRAASDEKPQRWLPRDNSGPTPAYEDLRSYRIARAADGPVQVLLAALSGTGDEAGAPPPTLGGTEASDPALRQALLEREALRTRRSAEEQAAGARYRRVLRELAEGHAVMAARSHAIQQRTTERELRLAEDRLRRAMAGGGAPSPTDLAAATGR